ncbi:FN3 associated domain-containing protein [Prevotella dentasini]
MNKILRYAAVAALALVSSLSFAQTTVTFVAGTDNGQNTKSDKPDQVVKEGVTIAADNAAFAAVNGGTQAGEYRIYKNATFTITSTAGNITKVEFTCATATDKKTGDIKYGGDGFDENESLTVSDDKKTATWTGDAATMSLTTNKAQVRASQIVVTIAGGDTPAGVAAPVISGEESFSEATTVTITGPEGATIYYTTNGQTPDDREGTKYTEPFTLTTSATVKAIAYVGDKESPVATKEFVKQEVHVVDNIAAFKQLQKGEKATLALNNAQVIYTWTSNKGNTSAYIRDNTGAIVFYKSTLGLAANEILNGPVSGSFDLYNSLPEFLEIEGLTNLNNVTRSNGEAAAAKAITVAEAMDNLCDLVKIADTEITSETVKDKNGKDVVNYYLVSGEAKVQLYNGFHLDAFNDLGSFAVAGKKYTVEGILGAVFKGVAEIYPTSITEEANGISSLNNDARSLNAPIYNLAGQRVSSDYKGVVIQNGKKMLKK